MEYPLTLTVPIPLTIGADTFSLQRINQDNFTAKYFDRKADSTMLVDGYIAHTIPARGVSTGIESHHARFDVARYDASGVLQRNESIWLVAKTSGGPQVNSTLVELMTGINTWLSATSYAEFTQLLNRSLG